MNKNYHSSTIQKAIDVLNLFSGHKKLSFTTIKENLGFNKSTLFRVLYTLEINNYLNRDEHGKYELGAIFFVLGNQFSREKNVKKFAKQYLKELSVKTGLTTQLGVLDGLNVIILDKVDPPNSIKMYSKVGAIVSPHSTGQGKTLLAYSSTVKLEEILEFHGLKKFTENTITSKDKLLKELNSIREKGYAVDNSEHEKHIKCVAVPILNDKNDIEAALSITGLVMDFEDRKTIENYSEILKETALKVKKKLGFE